MSLFKTEQVKFFQSWMLNTRKPLGHISHHHSALAERIVQIEPGKDLFTCHIQIAEA